MSSRLRSRRSAPVESGGGQRVVRRAPRWRPMWVGFAVLAALIGGSAASQAVFTAREREQVLAVAKEVPAGQVIPADAIAVVEVAIDNSGVLVVPVEQRDRVVGRPASRRLVPGQLVSPADVSLDPLMEEGDRRVGVTVGPGRYPADLAAGESVAVYPSGGGEAGVTARVFSVGVDDQVVLVVAEPDAERVAQWSAGPGVVLVAEPLR